MSDVPLTIGSAEMEELDMRWRVTPSAYTKPFRLYCDVDGVIKPSLREKEDFDRYGPLAVEIDILPPSCSNGPAELLKGKFYWDADVIERLAALSRSSYVDFVWLTDRRLSAPYALDKLLGIESLGFLDWEPEFADWSQAFKRIAIQEDQKAVPSKFIWLDDRANLPFVDCPHAFAVENDDFEIKFDNDFNLLMDNANAYRDIIPASQYLSITTMPRTGITMTHMDTIEAWVKENLGK